MMYGYGFGGWWMMLMPLLWIAVIAVIVWVVARAIQPRATSLNEPPRQTPLEILDRRFALGEIDDNAYTAARAHLTGREQGSS